MPALAGAFATAPQTNFYVLHDKPDDPATSAAATMNTAKFGESALIATCPAASLASPCGAPQYYMALDHTIGGIAIVDGLNSRISKAGGAPWTNQDCSRPQGGAGVPPLTPDNPRLVRVPIAYATPAPFAPGVGQGRVSETLMFCLQYTVPLTTMIPTPTAGGDYFVPGYFVNEADLSATSAATPGRYFGQDVLVRLIP